MGNSTHSLELRQKQVSLIALGGDFILGCFFSQAGTYGNCWRSFACALDDGACTLDDGASVELPSSKAQDAVIQHSSLHHSEYKPTSSRE